VINLALVLIDDDFDIHDYLLSVPVVMVLKKMILLFLKNVIDELIVPLVHVIRDMHQIQMVIDAY
jgi:hypothetical protein